MNSRLGTTVLKLRDLDRRKLVISKGLVDRNSAKNWKYLQIQSTTYIATSFHHFISLISSWLLFYQFIRGKRAEDVPSKRTFFAYREFSQFVSRTHGGEIELKAVNQQRIGWLSYRNVWRTCAEARVASTRFATRLSISSLFHLAYLLVSSSGRVFCERREE